jgi:hypothetical protein
MEWFTIIAILAIALLILRFIKKILFKVVAVAVIVFIVMYFFPDLIPW